MTVLAQPRLLALNNEPAVVRGARKEPEVRSEITLGVTAQGADGIVMLSVSPIVSTRERRWEEELRRNDDDSRSRYAGSRAGR